jgi:glycosyltransferase involved in cell wall biosynthesis
VKLRLFGNIPKGNEAYADRLGELIRKRRLDSTIVFEGIIPRERIVDAYRAGDVVVLSSISEGFPYTVVEAMMAGRATVSTDVGGVAEAVGDAGLVVPPRDPAAFAAACVRLLEDPSERERLARRARERALACFTIARFLALYRETYAELCAEPRTVVAHELAPIQSARAPGFGQLGSAIAT